MTLSGTLTQSEDLNPFLNGKTLGITFQIPNSGTVKKFLKIIALGKELWILRESSFF